MKPERIKADRAHTRWLVFAVCACLLALTWFVFGQTLKHDFTNYDDDIYVYQNPNVTSGLNVSGVAWAFGHVHGQNWHPLTTISHMLDCQIYQLHPAGHHWTNVVLHAAAVLLLFFTTRQLTGAFWRSAIVAAVFAVHPLRVESVAWIAERKDVLSGIFFILTVAAYTRYVFRPSVGRYITIAAAFAAGLMSKPMLVTTPLVLLLLDWWPLQRFPSQRQHRSLDRQSPISRLLAEKVPLVLLSAISAGVTLFVQRQLVGLPADLPLRWRLTNAVTSCVVYIRQMFWPTRLAVFYPHPESSTPVWLLALTIALLAILTLLAIALRNRAPYLFTGWFWYVIMLVPVVGIVQVGWQGHADRYTYLPQIGLYLTVVWAISDLAAKGQIQRSIVGVAAVAVITIFAGTARTQAGHWRNSETLWRHTLAVTGENDVAENNLGIVLLAQGKVDDAIAHFEAALSLRPANAPAHANLAKAFLQQARFEQATAHAHQLLELEPDNQEARNVLGTIFARTGRLSQARDEWEKTLAINRDNGNANSNLAWLYATSPDESLRDSGKAVACAERALRLSGGRNALVFRTVAAAYAEAGRFSDAVQAAERGRELALKQGNPSLADELIRNIELYSHGGQLRDYSLTNGSR